MPHLGGSDEACTAMARLSHSWGSVGFKAWEMLNELHGRVSHRIRVPLAPARGIISFSFDDFPASAWRLGGAILRAHGVYATYYVSMGLERRRWHGSEGFSRDDVVALVQSGHELGCHTFSHLPWRRFSEGQFVADLDRNARSCRLILGGAPFATFAYPFGFVSASAKCIVARRFAAARHIRKGVNLGTVDLAQLRANEINAATPMTAHTKLIERCRDQKGWLLFFTHDISERPSPWGCAPWVLAELVEQALASGCAVLPVGAAAAAVAGPASGESLEG